MSMTELFDDVREAPDPDLRAAYGSLVGIDGVKSQIEQHATLLLAPERLVGWSNDHYGEVLPAVVDLTNRTPLILLGGDVGTGKTVVATSFADALARSLDMDLTVFHLGLSSRGQGAVGEMTKRIGAAFKEVTDHARRTDRQRSPARQGCVLVIDEADSVAQSRELDQMHHEDRAGVNAIIRGIDSFAVADVAAICVMCTNRPDAIDPAVQRRAALTVEFSRPNPEQRRAVLQSLLGGALTNEEYMKLAEATGEMQGNHFGYTFSDLRTRLIPALLIAGLDRGPLTLDMALDTVEQTPPTAPFGASS